MRSVPTRSVGANAGGYKGITMTGNSASNKLMQAFFSPAAALMNRLNVSGKFTLLGLMSLVAIAVVVYLSLIHI